MALSDDEILSAWSGQDERFLRPVLGRKKILIFARAIEAEVHKQDDVLIGQLVEALEDLVDTGAESWGDWRPCVSNGQKAIDAARARLEDKP